MNVPPIEQTVIVKTPIEKLIETLQNEKRKGAITIELRGVATIISDNGNTVILTTQPQY